MLCGRVGVGRPGVSKQDGGMCRRGMVASSICLGCRSWERDEGEEGRQRRSVAHGNDKCVCVCRAWPCLSAKRQRGKDKESKRTHQGNQAVEAKKKKEVKSQGRDEKERSEERGLRRMSWSIQLNSHLNRTGFSVTCNLSSTSSPLTLFLDTT